MAIEGAYDRQLGFPWTPRTSCGRLRREHFTIFKKGSKGVSYVCAVKRKFRVPGQVFGESIGSLIAFIEEHPLVKAGELASKMLGIADPRPRGPRRPEQREKIMRMQGDLHLARAGGLRHRVHRRRALAPPAMVEARKKEVEAEEHDPENFPEAPPPADARARPPSARLRPPKPRPRKPLRRRRLRRRNDSRAGGGPGRGDRSGRGTPAVQQAAPVEPPQDDPPAPAARPGPSLPPSTESPAV